ncbi:2-polyprenyl-6-methoxyphenol hydroxylase-likeoxidoreductase [Striga asiatica]|uniref:2-polyprenyl-6-methoxyphenol hydroxylase-likeoxidoreductase n=1 Tax=Striga asiatica TaxID=4170 RepID=A0A5A7PNW9_STRAF|nr:2-polyprenyl-6-methoxyphenol hydroxylase-likeoxidoreductase [Striga asiatica]
MEIPTMCERPPNSASAIAAPPQTAADQNPSRSSLIFLRAPLTRSPDVGPDVRRASNFHRRSTRHRLVYLPEISPTTVQLSVTITHRTSAHPRRSPRHRRRPEQ